MRKLSMSLVCLIMIIVLLTSCKTDTIGEKPNITDIPTSTSIALDTTAQPNIIDDTPIGIFLPSMSSKVDYDTWVEYFHNRFNIELSIYTKNNDGDHNDKYLIYDLDSTEVTTLPLQINWGTKYADRTGIYLINNWGYYFYYQHSINNLTMHPDTEQKDRLISSMWQPLNDYDVCELLEPEFLLPYTDGDGNIWALPYEYKYPEVRVRKYNEEIMKDLSLEVPETINALYNLLFTIKNKSDIPNVLPSMNRNSVFSGFEDIVYAFGIKKPSVSSLDVFYSIQYDEKQGNYVDIAFDENMKQCIEFFVVLIDNGLIKLEGEPNSSNDLFHDELIFSVYDVIDNEADLSAPYSLKLSAYEYEPALHFNPSRYVYVLGREQQFSQNVEDVLTALYLSDETKLSARFGKKDADFFIDDNVVKISQENYMKAPKLIGEFADDSFKLIDDELQALKDKITQENVSSGYYRVLYPVEFGVEAECNPSMIYAADGSEIKYDVTIFAQTFYQMLSDYFFDEDRPTIDEFLINYRASMKKQLKKPGVHGAYYEGWVIEMDFVY